MRWALLVLVGCGRIAFDPLAGSNAADDGSVGDGGTDDGGDAGSTIYPFVRDQFATEAGGNQNSIQVRFPRPIIATDYVIVTIGFKSGVRIVSSVTDTAGTTYAPILALIRNTSAVQAIYHANAVAAAANTNTLTVTFDGVVTEPAVSWFLYGNVESSAPIETSKVNAGVSALCSSGPLAQTSGPRLIVSACTGSSTVTSAGAGFTAQFVSLVGHLLVEDREAVPGTYDATANIASGDWVIQVVALRAPGT